MGACLSKINGTHQFHRENFCARFDLVGNPLFFSSAYPSNTHIYHYASDWLLCIVAGPVLSSLSPSSSAWTSAWIIIAYSKHLDQQQHNQQPQYPAHIFAASHHLRTIVILTAFKNFISWIFQVWKSRPLLKHHQQ